MDTRVKADTAFDLGAWSTGHLDQVERALDRWVRSSAPVNVEHEAPAALIEAMRYAVLDGGKRLRPLLVLAAWESVTRERARSAPDWDPLAMVDAIAEAGVRRHFGAP